MKSFLLSLTLAMTVWSGWAQNTSQHNFDIAKQLEIFNALYKELDQNYVDSLSAEKNINNAILYMLNQLDPYTEYYAENKTQDLKQLTTGKYAGIGSVISYNPATKRCIINDPYQGMPAAEAGLQVGDVILAIDGKDVGTANTNEYGEYSNNISSQLRGKPGTQFTIKVQRFGVDKPLTFNVTRRIITLPAVPLYKMLNDSIGYIDVTSFNEQTTNEVRQAFLALKDKGMNRLVLDLRNNPGGLLNEAVKLVGMFVPRGKTVVSIKGKVKENNATYKTQIEPLDLRMPMVVLVNEGTASAAEITAGALQDYDRAIVLGHRTYGKGLVQQPRELPFNSILKLTTSKYYIPSGRCVQAYSYKDGMPEHLPDSVAKVFHTAGGRPVLDSGGITPDLKMPKDSLPNLLSELAFSDALRHYCTDYHRRHRKIATPDTFQLTPEEYNDFKKFLLREHFTYDSNSRKALDVLRNIARTEGYAETTQEEFDALEKKLTHNYDFDFQRWEPEIRKLIEAELLKRYYYQKGVMEYALRHDKTTQKACQLLEQPKTYVKMLSHKGKK